jgi:hypothetical protein
VCGATRSGALVHCARREDGTPLLTSPTVWLVAARREHDDDE